MPEDGCTLPPFQPRQYLAVRARLPGQLREQIRQYSLAHAPNGRFCRIAVRREDAPSADVPAGLMSSYLHAGLRDGDALLVHVPLGDLVLDRSERPVVLLSGGSGTTPVLAMLDQLTSHEGGARPVTFIHAAQRREVMAFGREIAALAARRSGVELVTVLDGDEGGEGVPEPRMTGRVSAELLRAHLAPDAEVYYCGPPGFMAGIETASDVLLGPAPRRHGESLAPDPSFGDGVDQPLSRATSVGTSGVIQVAAP